MDQIDLKDQFGQWVAKYIFYIGPTRQNLSDLDSLAYYYLVTGTIPLITRFFPERFRVDYWLFRDISRSFREHFPIIYCTFRGIPALNLLWSVNYGPTYDACNRVTRPRRAVANCYHSKISEPADPVIAQPKQRCSVARKNGDSCKNEYGFSHVV